MLVGHTEDTREIDAKRAGVDGVVIEKNKIFSSDTKIDFPSIFNVLI